MPSSRAISAIGRPLVRTSSTASRLNSGVNCRLLLRCCSGIWTASSHRRCPATGGKSTLAQRLVDGVQLLVGQARGVPGRAGAAQRLQPALAPMGVPAADVLAGHAELVGDLGLGVAGGEQLAGLHADAFERLAVARTAGVAAVGGWSHTAILPGH